jgi:hypothetical protein
MTKKERELLEHNIECEGFDYCFTDYSNWEEIKDKKFQCLREKYANAAKELKEYVLGDK